MERDLTKGSIKKHYFKYLYSAFGSAMIACVYGLVDAAVVGQYKGPSGTAALSIVLPVWTILYSLGLLIGIGGSVNYSYHKAQNKTDKANAFFTLSFGLTVVASVACLIGIGIFDDELLRFFGADEILLPLAKEYFLPIKFVIPAYPLSQLIAAYLRNDGAPGLATFATLFGGIFNIFGDIYFVFGLKLGMFGAGLATAIGAILTLLIMLSHFASKKNTLKFVRVNRIWQKTATLTISGFPSFISDIAMGVVAILFNRQIMQFFGADALAVFGVIVQLSCMVQCSTYGVGQAAQPIISANFGAKRTERTNAANKLAIYTVIVFSFVWVAVGLVFPNAFVRFFMVPTETVLRIAPSIIRVYSLSYLMLPFNIYATYYFQSIMRPKSALVVSLSRGIVLCGALVFVLPAIFGAEVIWWVMPITETAVAAYVVTAMKSAKKRVE